MKNIFLSAFTFLALLSCSSDDSGDSSVTPPNPTPTPETLTVTNDDFSYSYKRLGTSNTWKYLFKTDITIDNTYKTQKNVKVKYRITLSPYSGSNANIYDSVTILVDANKTKSMMLEKNDASIGLPNHTSPYNNPDEYFKTTKITKFEYNIVE